MNVQANAKRGVFDRSTRLMHWLTAGLMLLVFTLAFSIDLAASRTGHVALLKLHRSVGLTIWALTLLRLTWRQFTKYPDWPTEMSEAARVVAKASEYGLYVLLLLQPFLGLLQTNAHGDRVNVFLIGQLPALIEKNRAFAEQLLIAHKAVGYTLLGLIVLHASAALYHHFIRRNDTLTAMLPAAAAWRSSKSQLDQGRSAAELQ